MLQRRHTHTTPHQAKSSHKTHWQLTRQMARRGPPRPLSPFSCNRKSVNQSQGATVELIFKLWPRPHAAACTLFPPPSTVLPVIVCLPHCFYFSCVVSRHFHSINHTKEAHPARQLHRLSNTTSRKSGKAEIISKRSSFNWKQIARLNVYLTERVFLFELAVFSAANPRIIWRSFKWKQNKSKFALYLYLN